MVVDERDSFNLDDRDRLPWLEPAEDFVEETVSPARIVGLVLVGLALLALIVGGGWWLKNRDAGDEGDVKLIAAQGGPYKVAINESDGKVFQGEGDSSFAASEGADSGGRIDNSRMPEAPLANVSRGSTTKEEAAKPAPKPMQREVKASVKDETKRPVNAVAAPIQPASAGAGGGALIQLGAYGSNAGAQEAWKKFTKRFDYLATLTNTVEPVSVGGQTLYRLRARATDSAEATGLCGKLRVAGESCMVVN